MEGPAMFLTDQRSKTDWECKGALHILTRSRWYRNDCCPLRRLSQRMLLVAVQPSVSATKKRAGSHAKNSPVEINADSLLPNSAWGAERDKGTTGAVVSAADSTKGCARNDLTFKGNDECKIIVCDSRPKNSETGVFSMERGSKSSLNAAWERSVRSEKDENKSCSEAELGKEVWRSKKAKT